MSEMLAGPLQLWIMVARDSPSKAPLAAIPILAPFSSSAGVPKAYTVPWNWSLASARARAASTAMAQWALCPQAWPSSGRASYSIKRAAEGPSPFFSTARKPVG